MSLLRFDVTGFKFYSPEGEETGAPTETVDANAGSVEERVEEKAFDPSSVDVENADQLASLSDEQLAEVEKFQKAKTEPAPTVVPDKDTTTTDTAAATAGAPAASTTEPGKLAGKYATPDDLVKGVDGLTEKLAYPKEVVETAIALARKTGDFAPIEAMYKTMEKRLGERGSATAAQETDRPAQTPATDTSVEDTLKSPETLRVVNQLTMQQLAASEIARKLENEGLHVPKSAEEFEALTVSHPYLAMQFQTAYTEIFNRNQADVRGHIEHGAKVESENARVIDADVAEIKAFAAENSIKLSDEEITAIKSAALARPQSFEDKYGHKFLRPSAVKEAFLVNVLPGKLKEAALEQQTKGRMQAIADLEKAGKREVSSLGTAGVGSRTRALPKMPDLTDPAVLAGLPDEALENPERYFKSFAKQ